MKNKVKYAPVRKYRDIGFNSLPEKQERKRERKSIVIKKKESFFQKIKRVVKKIFKK
jgi:hypothetical protein